MVADRIDPAAKLVLAADGIATPYDHLVLATGSYSYLPPMKGVRTDAGQQLAVTVDSWNDGLLALTDKRTPAGAILSVYGMDDAAVAALADRWQAWWGKHFQAPQPASAIASFERTVVPDPVLLFRYSALTFNSHRIHYDRDYATRVEGYPGLVVHGPLIATLLADLLRSEMPDVRLRRFAFTAMRPLSAAALYIGLLIQLASQLGAT